MLAIIFQSGRERQWHVGSPSPINGEPEVDAIKYIQADGHELDHIKLHFADGDANPAIPMVRGQRVLRWYGDIAKTIITNLF